MINLKNYPTPSTGVSLGFAGIMLFWASISQNATATSLLLMIGLIIATLLMVPVMIKFSVYPKLLLADLQHPTVGSVVPTLAMTLMILSHTVVLFYLPLGIAIWCIATFLHVVFFIIFTYHRFREPNLNHIVPSWFVPPIGIVVATLVVPTPALKPIAEVILWFGIASYLIMLPIVLYRLSLGEKIEDTRKPTLAILAAPASLSLAGYLTLITNPDPLLTLFLASVAVLMTVSVYLMLLHLLRLTYSPAFAAFTFPLAISATASMKFSIYVTSQPLLQPYAHLIYNTSRLEAGIATLVICYVVIRTIHHNFFCK